MTASVPAAETRAAFRDSVGRDPDGVWSAPGRVNLIGEHTDYNGGFVLPFAIDRRTLVAAAKRGDGVVTARSLQRRGEIASVALENLSPGSARGWPAYVFGVIWALRQRGHDLGGLDIVLDSTVPSGSGLSSSAALECATGLAALESHGLHVAPAELARIAQLAENEFVGVPCGLMDQMAASVCRAGHALFFDVRDDVVSHEPFSPEAGGLALLVIDTRARHQHDSGAYAKRRHSCEDAARQLGVAYLRDVDDTKLDDALALLDDETLRKRVRHVVTENGRVLAAVELLRAGATWEIGPLLTASHASLRDDFEVSCVELDVAVDAALAAGAFGARMTGGGFGGSAIALVEDAATLGVAEAVEAAFRDHGIAAPNILRPAIDGGARRES